VLRLFVGLAAEAGTSGTLSFRQTPWLDGRLTFPCPSLFPLPNTPLSKFKTFIPSLIPFHLFLCPSLRVRSLFSGQLTYYGGCRFIVSFRLFFFFLDSSSPVLSVSAFPTLLPRPPPPPPPPPPPCFPLRALHVPLRPSARVPFCANHISNYPPFSQCNSSVLIFSSLLSLSRPSLSPPPNVLQKLL